MPMAVSTHRKVDGQVGTRECGWGRPIDGLVGIAYQERTALVQADATSASQVPHTKDPSAGTHFQKELRDHGSKPPAGSSWRSPVLLLPGRVLQGILKTAIINL